MLIYNKISIFKINIIKYNLYFYLFLFQVINFKLSVKFQNFYLLYLSTILFVSNLQILHSVLNILKKLLSLFFHDYINIVCLPYIYISIINLLIIHHCALFLLFLVVSFLFYTFICCYLLLIANIFNQILSAYE